MFKVCKNDILRNRYFFFLLFLINAVYVGIHFLPEAVFTKVLWGYETAYVIFLVVLIPVVLFLRYGDKNRLIIADIIEPKIWKVQAYYWVYVLGVWLTVSAMFFITVFVLLFVPKADLLRNICFLLHLIITAGQFLLLFIGLVNFIRSYMFAWVAYLVAVFILMIMNAPASYLWFIYGNAYTVWQHWIGKICFFAVLFVFCIISIVFDKQIKKREGN